MKFTALINILNRFWPQLVLLLIIFLIAVTNYQPGTVLSGWDNLHPEFGFELNIKRSVYAVWQEYQGLGLLGGMGHASDLTREIFLWITSFVIPENLNRYFFHFLMLFIGPLGIYYLMNNYILNFPNHTKKIISLSSAIFYLFNLATVQMFNVPFEPYSVHYAFLPWLIYANLQFYRHPDKNKLFFLILINFLAVPQGYIGTFFLVYFIVLSLIFLQMFFKHGKFKRILLIYFLLFLTNAFWLIPNLYFIRTKISVNTDSKINQLATEDVFLRNKKYGNLSSVLLLKGFWFDNSQIDNDGITRFQMQDWIDYLNNPLIIFIGYSFSVIALIGLIASILKKENNAVLFIPVLLFSFIVLANDSPIIKYFTFLLYKIPLFSQVFRFPFTKLSILYIFCLALFYGMGLHYILFFINSNFRRLLLLIVMSFLPIYYCLPILSGKLFYYKVHARIPQEYGQLFTFFKNRPKNERIANFPQYTLWGWTFYRWNYSGSGFIWYGIEQPILDRAFDVWSRESENYYHEISYAIYSRNFHLFEKILRKYNISWIIFDGNVISYSNSRELYSDKLENILLNSRTVSKTAEFGKLRLYKVQLPDEKNIVFKPQMPIVLPVYNSNNFDRGYYEYDDYISQDINLTSNYSDSVIYYPFRSLFTGRSQDNIEFKIVNKNSEFILNAQIPVEMAGSTLYLPPLAQEDTLELNSSDLSVSDNKYPQINLDGENIPFNIDKEDKTLIELPYIKKGKLEIRIPKIKGYFSYANDDPLEFNGSLPFPCEKSDPEKNIYEKITLYENNLIRLKSTDGTYCLNYYLDHLPHNISYLLTVDNRNISGRGLYLSIINNNSNRADAESYLPEKEGDNIKINKSYFIIPPMKSFARGYLINIKNISIGRETTVNDVGKITVNPFPFRFLTGIKIIKRPDIDKTEFIPLSSDYKIIHPHPGLYTVQGNVNNPENQSPNQLMILAESYDKEWKAYFSNCVTQSLICRIKNFLPFKFYPELKDHVLVNNWENGWILPQTTSDQSPKTIIIVYLPQYFEYLGFALWFILPITLLLLPRESGDNRN